MISYDTQGRYTELENLTNSINHNAVTTGILVNDRSVLVFFEDSGTDLEILKVYKLTKLQNIVVVLTGVKGDMKFLMGLIKYVCTYWNVTYRDIVTAAYISNTIADYIHSYTLRKNLRPLGGIIIVADTVMGHIYRIGVDSAYERSNLFVVGKNSKRIETKLNSLQTWNKSVVLEVLTEFSQGVNYRIEQYERTQYSSWKKALV